MAETDKKEEGRPSGRNSNLTVRTMFPHGSFVVEGVPEITAEGTQLTQAQFSQVEKVAPALGVRLEVEESS